MSVHQYNKTNFHKHTFCIFEEVDFTIVQNLKANYKSKSGSLYYFTEEGVYRHSNHWGRAANCKWRLVGNSKMNHSNSHSTKTGFANWDAFYPDNETEKLYFIEADYALKLVNFYHKKSKNYTPEKVLRTAPETTKCIKQIRTLLKETAWANHYREKDIEVLRKVIIEKLVTTNMTLLEIKRQFLSEY